MDESEAYHAGHLHGKTWTGPNGDKSFGALSLTYIRECAAEFVADHKFIALTSFTPEERKAYAAYMRGFAKGLEE